MLPQKVFGSIAIEIPILWPHEVMVSPRPHVLLTLPLCVCVCVCVCVFIIIYSACPITW